MAVLVEIPQLPANASYEGSVECCCWAGFEVTDVDAFSAFMVSEVRRRAADDVFTGGFERELRGLATTGMASEFLEQLLSSVPSEPTWGVGEALAEAVLQEDTRREVVWPWNTARDRRAPRASLPGADLVGFCRAGEDAVLLFGEVKTSSDAKSPPGVMYGGTGMVWQLEASATRLDVQHTLLKWLRSRCHTAEHVDLYQSAVGRYLESGGKEILIVGVLLRDTKPNELDVRNRGKALARKLNRPTRVEVIAWYLPVRISDWVDLLKGGAA